MALHPRVLLTVLLAGAVAGCSWTTLFVIVNRSAEAVRIAYTVRRLNELPAVKAIRELAADARPWKELEVSLPPQERNTTLTLVLGPDSALRVASGTNCTASSGADGGGFNITSIEFRSSGGERSFRGNEVLTAFTESSRDLCILEYP